MKKIKIQDKLGERLEYENNFSVLKQNRILVKNESNKRYMSCNHCFSGLKFGIFLYFTLIASFVVFIVGASGISTKNEVEHFIKYPLMLGLGISVFVILLFLSIARVLSSPITQSLKEFRKDIKQPLDEYIEGIKQSTVELIARCECYHETSSTTTNSDGSTSTTTSTIVTYREELSIPLANSRDLTTPLVFEHLNSILGNNSESKKYLIVSFIRYWYPMDQDSQEVIKSYLDYLTVKNENRDSQFRLILDLNYSDKRFKEHLLFPIKSFKNNIDIIEKGPSDTVFDSPPVLFRYGYYVLSLFLFLFLPYELYFNSKVYKSKFTFIKLVKASTTCQEYLLNNNDYNNTNNNNNYQSNNYQSNNYQSNNYKLLNDQEYNNNNNNNNNNPSSSSSSYLPHPIPIKQEQKEKSVILDKESDNLQQDNNNENDSSTKDKSINNIDK